MIDWRTALVYVTRERAWKRRVAVGGAWMLLVPPLGWVLALGYRSVVGNRFLERRHPLLPAWSEDFGLIFRRGVASSGVILGYLTPFLAAYWIFGLESPHSLLEHARAFAAFISAVIVFPPLALPTLPFFYGWRFDWLRFSPAEMTLLAALFLCPIAVLPAAFLQVAHRRRFPAAFDIVAALRLIAAVPRLYVEAWLVSVAVSAVALAVVPLTPWLLFWSYLVISHVFLQVLSAVADVRRA